MIDLAVCVPSGQPKLASQQRSRPCGGAATEQDKGYRQQLTPHTRNTLLKILGLI